jgi:multicomponent Na+:H+ antiporter subunit G
MAATVLDAIAIALLGLGLLFATIGLYGLLRMPHIFAALHAAGLVTGPAVICVLLASVAGGSAEIITSAVLVLLFVVITSPLSGHAIAQAARREPAGAEDAGGSDGVDPVGSPSMNERLLIAVGQAATSAADVPRAVRAVIDGASEIMVIAPTLPGRLQWLVSDTDRATERADERLRAVLGHLDELGATATGRVGADEPLVAFDDAVREFEPGHILIALRPEERAGWQERGLIDAVLARFELPVTVFVLTSS